jgi:hypothetical protein
MSRNHEAYFEHEMATLVEEFLERDLVSPEARRRAERLRSNGRTADALEVLLEDRRRRRSGPAALHSRAVE